MPDDTLSEAFDTYTRRPEALTRLMVARLTKADRDLGRRARERYRETRDRALADAVAAVVNQALQTRDTRITALEEQVLELRATVAAREPVP